MAFVESIERSDFCRGLNFIIICEFSEEEPSGPVFLAMVKEGANILLYFLISMFSLTIGLEIKGSREVDLDAQETLQFHSELECKLGASV